ncbi:MAG: serine/threonine protein kinase [Planctomycetota bacterium]|nr:MAG: serine/threonine protein kinase [Planctomycetota bacterium]
MDDTPECRRMSEQTTAPFAEDQPFRAIPTRIGRYIVGERIGMGGMGVVHKAEHLETGATVALKVIRAEAATDETFSRLKREAKALGSLRHPGIAVIHDAGTEDVDGVVTPYIAMEYIPGAMPITAYASKLSEREKLELFVRVCRAIDHANARGIIHRDLKPSNILVDADGVAKVIDFGVAKVVDAMTQSLGGVTEQGRLVGTPEYMAPEQVRCRSELIDARTDVYGLGVVLYEMLCGRMPYEVSRRSPLEALRVICDDPPTQPTSVRPGFSNELETIVLKMLAKERPRRYQTAGEAADDIERYLRGLPVRARRDTLMYRFRKALSRAKEHNPVATATAIMVIGIALSIVVGVRVVYPGLGLAARYVGWVTGAAATAPQTPEHVVVVGLRDPEKLAALGIGSIDPGDVVSWRTAHGKLLERLSMCEPRAVGLDFRFLSCENAGPLVEGMRRLRQRGIGTVVGTQTFVRPGERPAEICPEIIDAAWGWGAVAVSEAPDAPFAVRLATMRTHTQARCASFGTALFALSRRPDAEGFDLNVSSDGVHINYVGPSESSQIRDAPEYDRLSSIDLGRSPRDDRRGIGEGDVIASAAALLGPWALEESAPYTQVMSDLLDERRWPIERLRAWVRGKTVIVADLRPGWDSSRTSEGEDFHRAYLWASWLEQALRDAQRADERGAWASTIRGAKELWNYAHVVIGAALGSLVFFFPLHRHPMMAIAYLVAVAVVMVVFSVGLLRFSGVLLVPLLGVFSLWTTGALCILFPRPLQV